MKKLFIVVMVVLVFASGAFATLQQRIDFINGEYGDIYKNRVKLAMMMVAKEVKAESDAVPNHAIRAAYAQNVIDFSYNENSAYVFLLTDSTIYTPIDNDTPGQISDTILLEAVRNAWDDLSGVM